MKKHFTQMLNYGILIRCSILTFFLHAGVFCFIVEDGIGRYSKPQRKRKDGYVISKK